jgi:hypothetical protein
LPQGLDVCIVEGLIEPFPQRQKRAVQGGIHDREQQNDVTDPDWQKPSLALSENSGLNGAKSSFGA